MRATARTDGATASAIAKATSAARVPTLPAAKTTSSSCLLPSIGDDLKIGVDVRIAAV
jgi:hypothetical protein